MKLFAKLLDALFPLRCAGCGVAALQPSALCGACFVRIRIASTLWCGTCRAACGTSPARAPCHRAFPCVMGAAARYDDRRVRAAIHALKFGGVRAAAEPLAELLVRYALRFPTLIQSGPKPIVTAVPLHTSRERARGFNQSALIAERFASRVRLEFRPGLILRVRATSPQTEIRGRAARAANVRGCFAPGGDAPAAGRTIILIDDVITSGATCREAAKALRAAGAGAVVALAVARA